MRALLLLAASAAGASAGAVLPCTADEDCLGYAATPRCLPSTQGAACTLDYGYNTTGICSCQAQSCVNLTGPAWDTSRKQWLVVGDSISLGQLGDLVSLLNATWQVVHAPSFDTGSQNNDNAFWGSRCIGGWLGTQPGRWDTVSYNAGLHDLAFPDNEHLSIPSYTSFIAKVLAAIAGAVRPSARIVWMRTTPVPINPPPQGGKSCQLIPGRVESDVLAYNAAADGVVAGFKGRVASCDLHKVITDYCGVGYSSCNITQCAGPHFDALGFSMLAQAAAGCATGA